MEGTFQTYCSPKSNYYYPAAKNFPKTVYIFACVVIIIFSILSTVGNIVILLALRKCQSLHPPSKALLYSLALTDLFVGLVVLPLFTADYMTVIFEIPEYYCALAITYGRTSTFIGAVSLEVITTIAIDRYLAFRLRLSYRQVMKLRRVVFILAFEWILAAIWTASWFLSVSFNMFFGAIGMFGCCFTTSLCYLRIYCGFRQHTAQIRQQTDPEPAIDLNMAQYKKTVNNMLWIYGVVILCYTPHFACLLAIFISGINESNRFALHLSAIAIYFNSSLNPILYCWKIKEIRFKIIAILLPLFNYFSAFGG